MKIVTALFVFVMMVFIGGRSWGQNLVPNPSFEDTVDCPSNYGQIYNAAGWSSYRYSPDYLNSCSQTNVSMPSNLFGYQQAKTGNAYAGLATYGMNGIDTVREYAGIQMSQSLSVGTTYFVSCFISRGDAYYSNGASNNFGFRFSTVSYNYLTNPFPIDNISQVHCDSIITDSINWIMISGSFVADSAYQYLILGNFYDNSHTDTIQINHYFAYYFIDDVSVTMQFGDAISTIAKQQTFSLSPNPVQNLLTINLLSPSALASGETIAVYDVAGRKMNCEFPDERNIGTGRIDNLELQLNTTTLPNGIYLVQVVNNITGVSEVGKFVCLH